MRYRLVVLIFGGLFVLAGCPTRDDDGGDDDDESITSCEAVEHCEGNYNIENKSDLESVALCQSVSGTLRLDCQHWLTSFSLPCLESMAGPLTILRNDSLVGLDVPALTSVDSLCIESNDSLTDLDGLTSLTSVDSLCIDRNASLTGFTMPTLSSVSGDLSIYYNDSLTSFDMPALTSVGGDLNIGSQGDPSYALTSFDMPALTSVDSLWIDRNADLTSLAGLSSLTSVGDYLNIADNDALTTLGGLSSLTSVGGFLYIADNDCLSQAEAEAFAASLELGATSIVNNNGANYPCS